MFETSESQVPLPNPAQLRWQNCELGVVYHYDMTTYMTFEDSGHSALSPCLPPETYYPARLDTDQWLSAAASLGAKYAIFTATHESGFLQWQSDLYPYGLKQTTWRDGKADVVGDFVQSCRKFGILPGIYLGLRHNAYLKAHKSKLREGTVEDYRKYIHYCEQMVEEICSRYGELLEIWFDGGALHPGEGGPDLLPIIEKYQPNIQFYHSNQRRDHRDVGNEKGRVPYPLWATMPTISNIPYEGDPEGSLWMPAKCNVPLRDHKWFWQPNQEHLLYPLEKLVEIYYSTVGQNCNLLLGLAPDREGLVPEADVRLLEQLGREIRQRFDTPLAEISGDGELIELQMDGSATIDQVVMMEDIARGERIRRHRFEGLDAAGNWRQLGEGSCIGHKLIRRIPPIRVSKLRLHCDGIGIPAIKSLAVFDTTGVV